MQHLKEGAASFLLSVRSLLHLATIVIKGLQLIRSDMEESGPFLRALIIDENVGLVKKAGKASFNTELLGRRPGMVFAAGAPAIEKGTLFVQFTHVSNHRGLGPFLSIDFFDERIVHIHIHK